MMYRLKDSKAIRDSCSSIWATISFSRVHRILYSKSLPKKFVVRQEDFPWKYIQSEEWES